MARLRLVFALLAAAILAATGLLAQRALRAGEVERAARHETLAERLFDEMERSLSAFLAREEERPFAQYALPLRARGRPRRDGAGALAALPPGRGSRSALRRRLVPDRPRRQRALAAPAARRTTRRAARLPGPAEREVAERVRAIVEGALAAYGGRGAELGALADAALRAPLAPRAEAEASGRADRGEPRVLAETHGPAERSEGRRGPGARGAARGGGRGAGHDRRRGGRFRRASGGAPPEARRRAGGEDEARASDPRARGAQRLRPAPEAEPRRPRAPGARAQGAGRRSAGGERPPAQGPARDRRPLRRPPRRRAPAALAHGAGRRSRLSPGAGPRRAAPRPLPARCGSRRPRAPRRALRLRAGRRLRDGRARRRRARLLPRASPSPSTRSPWSSRSRRCRAGPARARCSASPRSCVVAAAAGLFALYRMVAVRLAFAQRRSNFAAAVSHELKTPLTAIRMYVEMLRDGLVPSEEKRREYYVTLGSETERLSRLIDNVLEFSRLERGTRAPRAPRGAPRPRGPRGRGAAPPPRRAPGLPLRDRRRAGAAAGALRARRPGPDPLQPGGERAQVRARRRGPHGRAALPRRRQDASCSRCATAAPAYPSAASPASSSPSTAATTSSPARRRARASASLWCAASPSGWAPSVSARNAPGGGFEVTLRFAPA